jgi:hypothetical protein
VQTNEVILYDLASYMFWSLTQSSSGRKYKGLKPQDDTIIEVTESEQDIKWQ